MVVAGFCGGYFVIVPIAMCQDSKDIHGLIKVGDLGYKNSFQCYIVHMQICTLTIDYKPVIVHKQL